MDFNFTANDLTNLWLMIIAWYLKSIYERLNK